MYNAFRADLTRYSARPLTALRALRLLLYYRGLQALLAYRLGRWLLEAGPLPMLCAPIGWPAYFLLSRYVRAAFDIRLELTAQIGRGLYIGHFGGILLSRCTLGAHCSIAQSVHITPVRQGDIGPAIGDAVWIGAHAKIIGSFRVGEGSTIAAGAVVLRNIPPRTLCIGSPARIVLRNYDNRAILTAQ